MRNAHSNSLHSLKLRTMRKTSILVKPFVKTVLEILPNLTMLNEEHHREDPVLKNYFNQIIIIINSIKLIVLLLLLLSRFPVDNLLLLFFINSL